MWTFSSYVIVYVIFPYQAFCFVGVLGISYAVAFIVSVCVEYPMMQLEKFIFKSDNWAQMSWIKVSD